MIVREKISERRDLMYILIGLYQQNWADDKGVSKEGDSVQLLGTDGRL
jgi:hypothetical protein